VGDQKGLGDKKQNYREKPEHHMKRAGFHSSAKEIWNYDRQNLGQDKIPESEFFSEFGAASLDFSCGGSEQAGRSSSQEAGANLVQEGALVCIEGERESIFFVRKSACGAGIRMAKVVQKKRPRLAAGLFRSFESGG
jgi:hypothetical protein